MGPLIAIVAIAVYAANLRFVLWIACLPALLAVALLIAGVSEPEHVVESRRTADFSFATARLLDRSFCIAAAFGAAMMLARFSEAFLILKASAAGLSTAYVPLVMVVMSGVYTFASYPAGALSDHIGRRDLLVAGIVVLIAADLVLGFTVKIAPMFIGVAPWGLHMGLTPGILSTLVADKAPADLRGTSFGMFNLVNGVALLLSSLIAGLLWDAGGAPMTFLAGAAFALLALAGASWVKTPGVEVKAHPSK